MRARLQRSLSASQGRDCAPRNDPDPHYGLDL